MTTPLVGFRDYSCLEEAYVEAMMQEALAEAEAAGAAGEYPIGAVVAIDGEVISRGGSRQREVRSQLAHAELEPLQRGGETYCSGVLRDDSRALFEGYEPRLLDWLDDRIKRHRQD
jgi:tRNA(Arg) A34 adenosine deaminase TadA